ncbi:hypothetical protein LTAR_01252 [Leptolinea tardivitalis]|nr:hypothetical protein LTAR_01252 [Leptolinea tardivitalis]
MKIIRIISALFFLFIIYVIVAADNGSLPQLFYRIYYFPNGDKLGHFILYGILAFLINCSFPERHIRIASIQTPVGSLFCMALASIEEFSQAFFPRRSASWADLASGILGILIFTAFSLLAINKFNRSKTKFFHNDRENL